MPDGEKTMGGYSTSIIVKDTFVLAVPSKMHTPGTAPLLCAGITVYSPMCHFGANKAGMKIAVVGLGGLGHMAVKFGKAFGQHVTVISRSDAKRKDAMKSLCADAFIASSDAEAVRAASESFDAIVDTVSAQHDIQQLLSMLTTDGKLLCVGVPSDPYQIHASGLVMKRRMIAGSLMGGIKETQEMLNFCAEKSITSDVEVINADDVNEAVERMVTGDVKYRFVIDTLASMIEE
jgi:D-arabinose 1-dehydrogenase-like Zn-dependent alcohol dehydrogenase